MTQGSYTSLFEKKIKQFSKTKYSSVVNSATSALHLSCKALDLKKNDLVWTTPITFAASANCALHLDAKIDFVDIDKKTFCMSVKALESKLKFHLLAKKQMPKIVIPVHLAGQSCDMQKIYYLSKKFNFKIIEDASHAIGSKYKNSIIGSCKYSDITIFSFHAVKIITTGEGGAALTNNKKLDTKIKNLRSHGITKVKNQYFHLNKMKWYYEQQSLGWNYRLTDIQAALGISQLKRIKSFIKKRNEIANQYSQLLKHSKITLQFLPSNTTSSRHLFIIRVSKRCRDKLFNLLLRNNIGVNLHYIPLFYHPYYKNKKININQYPESKLYYKEAISLPMHTLLKKTDIIKISNIIVDFINKN